MKKRICHVVAKPLDMGQGYSPGRSLVGRLGLVGRWVFIPLNLYKIDRLGIGPRSCGRQFCTDVLVLMSSAAG